MKTQTLDAGERRPSTATTARSSNELVLSRLLDAPRELVWKAWTEPEHLIRRCAPHDFTITHCEGFSLSLTTADEAEAKRLFDLLAEGGHVQMPLSPTFWSPCFGSVTDKFGKPRFPAATPGNQTYTKT